MPPTPPVTSASVPRASSGGAGYSVSRAVETIPIIGGTGALGFGLALRLATAGTPVVIGSRDAGRAEEAAAKVREQVPGAQVEGLENPEAAQRGPIVFLTVPFRAQSENLTNLKQALSAGPDPGGRHRAAGRRGVGQGHAAAGRAPGIGRPAGPGDGARRRDRGQRPAHGGRGRRSPTWTSSSTRTCWWPATTGTPSAGWPS